MGASVALVGRSRPEMGRVPAEEGRGGLPADPGRESGLVWLGLHNIAQAIHHE